jgi:hypothetical protein
MKLELRYVKAIMKDLEAEPTGDNLVGEEIEVLDTIEDTEVARLVFASNGFDIGGKLNQITYRGYDIEKKCLFVISAIRFEAE